jgi:predicted DNA-binding helix-hairpin-helix protein
LYTSAATIGVITAAMWLLRDTVSLLDFGPEEGSLVVNVNTGTQEELETVPGIGQAVAARIIAGRPYESVDDLLRISGIGQETLDSMRAFLAVDGETRKRR